MQDTFRTLRLIKDVKIDENLSFKSGTDFTITEGIIYMNEYPVIQEMQNFIFGWIQKNPQLFEEDHRQF